MHRLIFFSAVLYALTAHASERHIARAALPKAVQMTVDAQSKGVIIKSFSTELENGRRVYEAEMVVDGHTRDLQILPDGTLSEVEEEVAFDKLPMPVQLALSRRAAGARIVKVESLTKQNSLVAYEASIRKGSARSEIQVGPDGGRLSRPE